MRRDPLFKNGISISYSDPTGQNRRWKNCFWNRRSRIFASSATTSDSHYLIHVPKMPQNGITLLLINLDNRTTVQVDIAVENAISNNTLKLEQDVRYKRKTKFSSRYKHDDTRYKTLREEYHLTAKDGDLHSRTMLLNGEILQVNSSGQIPPLEPKRVDPSELITVAPYSILFARIPIQIPACQ